MALAPHDGDFGALLAVFAHPDDEAYLAGGVMAVAADAGRRVACVTATKGELGFPDDDPRPLEPADVRGPEGADHVRILTEALLDAAPPVVPHHVEHRRVAGVVQIASASSGTRSPSRSSSRSRSCSTSRSTAVAVNVLEWDAIRKRWSVRSGMARSTSARPYARESSIRPCRPIAT